MKHDRLQGQLRIPEHILSLGGAMMSRGTVAWLLLGVLGCATKIVAPPPASVHRIVVLPPKGPADLTAGATAPATLTVPDLVSAAARLQLAEKGYEVVDPVSVETATKGRRPTSSEMAAEIVVGAHLDATVMYIDLLTWQPLNQGMCIGSIVIGLEVTLVDPHTHQVVWRIHRTPKPVPLYGVLVAGQAETFAAEAVMREVLAPFPTRPAG
jgi:hypothetical protein